MVELPLHSIFVYSKVDEFCVDMFPPNAGQIRKRFKNSDAFLVAQNSDTKKAVAPDPEAMSCIYSFYADMESLYVNLYDAYVSFKQGFVGFEIEDAIREVERRRDQAKFNGKSKSKKKKRSDKEEMEEEEEDEMDTDEEIEALILQLDPQKEKMTQIEFRMSIDDLRFCGFLKATNRKKEALMKMAELL